MSAAAGDAAAIDPATADKGSFIKVGRESNVKAVAGKIAHSVREGEPPAML